MLLHEITFLKTDDSAILLRQWLGEFKLKRRDTAPSSPKLGKCLCDSFFGRHPYVSISSVSTMIFRLHHITPIPSTRWVFSQEKEVFEQYHSMNYRPFDSHIMDIVEYWDKIPVEVARARLPDRSTISRNQRISSYDKISPNFSWKNWTSLQSHFSICCETFSPESSYVSHKTIFDME